MFWRKRQERKKAIKKIEGQLWGYMVSQHGVAVDILQNLRRVERDGVIRGKQVIMIRIFHAATANGKDVAIDGYESLDSHPELILYEGYYLEIGGEAKDIHIEKKQDNEPDSRGKP
jgi:hypothetical protein